MNMFKKSVANTIEEYIDALPKDRRVLIKEIHSFIQKSVPDLKPYFATNMIGYGKFQYKNSKKQTLDWPVVALASQKNYISLYVCSIVDGKYVAETNKKELGDVKVGKSCISIKKIEDLNLLGLKKVLEIAKLHPGLHT